MSWTTLPGDFTSGRSGDATILLSGSCVSRDRFRGLNPLQTRAGGQELFTYRVIVHTLYPTTSGIDQKHAWGRALALSGDEGHLRAVLTCCRCRGAVGRDGSGTEKETCPREQFLVDTLHNSVELRSREASHGGVLASLDHEKNIRSGPCGRPSVAWEQRTQRGKEEGGAAATPTPTGTGSHATEFWKPFSCGSGYCANPCIHVCVRACTTSSHRSESPWRLQPGLSATS